MHPRKRFLGYALRACASSTVLAAAAAAAAAASSSSTASAFSSSGGGSGGGGSGSGGSSRLPTVAVVAAEESLRRIPAATKAKVNMVRVSSTPAGIAEQARALSEAEGLLWIPDPGSPSAPSDALGQVWTLLPRCRWVHSFAAGVDGLRPFIDGCLVPESDRVVLTNGRGAFSSSLGEYALASMLYFNKQLARCAANRPEKRWDYFTMDVMAGKTIGLVGYGSIGQSAGRAAKGAFPSCRVLALRRRAAAAADDEVADEVFGVEDRLRFFAECDFVVCSLPSTPATQKFVGAEEIAAMKPSAVFISIGRGAAVDEEALIEALKAGKLGGAALDVFQKEPLPKESPLWDLENVLITAHNADYTADYFELGCKVFDDNVEAFLACRAAEESEGGKRGLFSASQPRPSGMATPVDLHQGY